MQQGTVREHEAFDILCMLPSDCSPYEAEGILLRRFGRVVDPRKESEAAVTRVAKANKAVKEQHVETFLVEQDEKHVRTTKHDLELAIGAASAHPISHGIGDSPRAKRRKGIAP